MLYISKHENFTGNHSISWCFKASGPLSGVKPLAFRTRRLGAEKKKTYTTTTERKSFGELFWPKRKTFQAGGGYKNPIKTRNTISTTEIFPLWTPFFFCEEKFCTGAGRCMLSFSQSVCKGSNELNNGAPWAELKNGLGRTWVIPYKGDLVCPQNRELHLHILTHAENCYTVTAWIWEVLKGVGVDGAGGNLPFFCAFLHFSSLFWRESPLFGRFSLLFCALS